MSVSVFDRVRTSLVQQRQHLATWLYNTPPQEKQLRLGPAAEDAVQTHFRVLDSALERAANHTLGLCEVCHDYIEPSRLEMDYTACVCLEHLAAEERRRLESDLELSQKVQQALLPQQVPAIPGLELAAFSQPARIVGGDYFDFLHFRDNTHGLVIADVVDKGMAASLLMASLQASLRILVLFGSSLSLLMGHEDSLRGKDSFLIKTSFRKEQEGKKDNFHNLIFGIDKTVAPGIFRATIKLPLSKGGTGGKRAYEMQPVWRDDDLRKGLL